MKFAKYNFNHTKIAEPIIPQIGKQEIETMIDEAECLMRELNWMVIPLSLKKLLSRITKLLKTEKEDKLN